MYSWNQIGAWSIYCKTCAVMSRCQCIVKMCKWLKYEKYNFVYENR